MEKSVSKIDMLSGSLLDKLLLFAIPIAASNIFQQLFNAVDVAVVGRFASSQAQAAVGCNGPVINLMINFFVGICMGSNVVIANYIGKQEEDKIADSVHTTMLVSIISGLLLLVVGIFIARPILVIMDTPSDILDQGILYLKIYFIGMPFIMVYNFGSAILRSIGDTKRPLYCLTLSGVVNVVLNLILVIVFHLDVAGVAIATVISNVISAMMIWHFLSHEKEPVRLSHKKLSIAKDDLLKILKIGLPASLQGIVFSVSNICIQTELNSYGSAAVAGSAIALNYEFFTYFIIASFVQTSTTFTSQNFGAGNYDRCKKIFRLCMICGILFTGIASSMLLLGRELFVSLFTSDVAVMEYAIKRMLLILSFNFIANTYEVGGATLRGMGYSMTPAVLTVFGTCILRLVWVYVVCDMYPGFDVLMAVYPVSWVVTGVAVLTVYFVIRRKAFSTARQA